MLIDPVADLLSDVAGIGHDDERRWRVFRARVGRYAPDVEQQGA